jgi:hypothetical protein
VLAAAVVVVAVVVVVVATTMAMDDFLFVSGTSPMKLDRTTLSGWCSTCRRWEVGLLPHPPTHNSSARCCLALSCPLRRFLHLVITLLLRHLMHVIAS